MNNKICFFCVGTGGHVLPVKNLVNELKKLDVDIENIIVVTDDRGKEYLDNLNINTFITRFTPIFQYFVDLFCIL